MLALDTKEKPFVCSCGLTFTRQDLLKRHARLSSHEPSLVAEDVAGDEGNMDDDISGEQRSYSQLNNGISRDQVLSNVSHHPTQTQDPSCNIVPLDPGVHNQRILLADVHRNPNGHNVVFDQNMHISGCELAANDLSHTYGAQGVSSTFNNYTHVDEQSIFDRDMTFGSNGADSVFQMGLPAGWFSFDPGYFDYSKTGPISPPTGAHDEGRMPMDTSAAEPAQGQFSRPESPFRPGLPNVPEGDIEEGRIADYCKLFLCIS